MKKLIYGSMLGYEYNHDEALDELKSLGKAHNLKVKAVGINPRGDLAIKIAESGVGTSLSIPTNIIEIHATWKELYQKHLDKLLQPDDKPKNVDNTTARPCCVIGTLVICAGKSRQYVCTYNESNGIVLRATSEKDAIKQARKLLRDKNRQYYLQDPDVIWK